MGFRNGAICSRRGSFPASEFRGVSKSGDHQGTTCSPGANGPILTAKRRGCSGVRPIEPIDLHDEKTFQGLTRPLTGDRQAWLENPPEALWIISLEERSRVERGIMTAGDLDELRRLITDPDDLGVEAQGLRLELRDPGFTSPIGRADHAYNCDDCGRLLVECVC